MFNSLIATLRGIPALPGAKCRGRSHLFDTPAPGEQPEVTELRHTQAIGLCLHCPALERCRDWVDGLKPSRRPLGVVAGTVNQPRRSRSTTATESSAPARDGSPTQGNHHTEKELQL